MSTDLERSRLDSSKVGITVTRTCAVCESSQKRTLFDQPLVVPSRCTYGSYTVVACEQCGFIYADNTITQEASDGHYAGPNKVTREFLENGEPDRDVKRLDNTAAAIGRFLKRETSVLDIGCGTGRLIGRLKEVGFARVCGLDQSAVAAEIARREYAVEVRTGSVFDEQEGRFGLAIVCHVLEHIVDLPTFLRRIYALLEDDGMTYIEVPDVRQFDRFVDPASSGPWIYVRDLFTHFTPGHVNFFSTVSLRNLMTRFGFDEVSCQSAPMGVVTSVWRRRPFECDSLSGSVLLRYAAGSMHLQEQALALIRQLAASGQEVLVWGAGLHTQRLLGSGSLGTLNIRAFVDSDPVYQSSQLAAKPIISPHEVAAVSGRPPILVSSWKAQSHILKTIESMRLPNRVVTLYSTRIEDEEG